MVIIPIRVHAYNTHLVPGHDAAEVRAHGVDAEVADLAILDHQVGGVTLQRGKKEKFGVVRSSAARFFRESYLLWLLLLVTDTIERTLIKMPSDVDAQPRRVGPQRYPVSTVRRTAIYPLRVAHMRVLRALLRERVGLYLEALGELAVISEVALEPRSLLDGVALGILGRLAATATAAAAHTQHNTQVSIDIHAPNYTRAPRLKPKERARTSPPDMDKDWGFPPHHTLHCSPPSTSHPAPVRADPSPGLHPENGLLSARDVRATYPGGTKKRA